MNRKVWGVFAVVCAVAMIAVWAAPALAQDEPKEKPPMYSYLGNWSIPRAQWAEMEKAGAANEKILQKAMADGTIVGYGNDVNLVHTPDGETHDDWWSAMSMAGILNVLDKFYKSGSSTSPVLASATKHWDNIFVSRYYNWHSGSYKGAYGRVAQYKLKSDAPNNAIDTLSKNLFVPRWRSCWPTARFSSMKSTRRRSTPILPETSGSSSSRPTRTDWTNSMPRCRMQVKRTL